MEKMDSPQFIKSLNSWKTNEYSIDVASYVPKFHIPTKSFYLTSGAPSDRLECKIIPGEVINIDSDNKSTDKLNLKFPPACIEQIDSSSWLKKYGLSVNRLQLEQILSAIGFKHTEDYIKNINRTISSKYSKGLYLQTLAKNGTIYNITCNQNKLIEYSERLKDVINTYKKRLQWLNSDSRRICGLITDKSVIIVIDCKQTDPKLFDQFRNCLIKTFREQVSRLAKFNLIRCSHEIEVFKDKAIQVNSDTIDEAIDWLNNWSHCYATMATPTSTCEACLVAFNDPLIESVYLITEGMSSNGSREILYEKITKQSMNSKIKFNVISYNCSDASTIEFLRRLTIGSYSTGKFHAYCLLKQVEHYTAGSINSDPTKSLVLMNKKQFGGTPPGSGTNKELMLIFEEMQNATENLEHVNNLVGALSAKMNTKGSLLSASSNNMESTPTRNTNTKVDEEYLSSDEYLEIYGLAKKKLQLFDVLAHVAFRHCDGVVDIKQAPVTGIGEAIPKEKLINAKYCDQFSHVVWNDGTIRHVHVTPEIHRNYEKSIRVALEQFDRRIKWLSKGSRELFGTVIENNIYILIDTSHSMQLSLDFVKQKLMALMQEQLKSKQRFNLVAFNNKVISWRDRMVEVDEFNFTDAWKWIKGLNAQGTTNTLAAIRFALSDINTEAIYLLTDGRPDQSPRQILSQVQLTKKVPIHVISFNCNDAEANKFLNQLAHETGGRYHYFNENFWSADPNGPAPFESRDVSLLKEEIAKGIKYLNQVEILRNECTKLSFISKKESLGIGCSKDHSAKEKVIKTKEELEIIEEFNNMQRNTRSSSFDFRFNTAKNNLYNKNNKESMLSSINDRHTSNWMLPETKELLHRQTKRQQKKDNKLAEKKRPQSEIRYVEQKQPEKRENYELSLREWLKDNSLKTLKLTILDALGPTVVKQHASRVDILDSYVTSKVWNDIFPLTNILSSKKNELKLINPKTVDLESYENTLEQQINIYKKYLTETVWNSLPQSEKNKLGATSSLEFLDEYNEVRLLKSLESCGWPIKEQDIIAIKREIDLAYKYLQQSKDLREFIINKEELIRKEKTINSEKEMIKALKHDRHRACLNLDSDRETKVRKSGESLEGKTLLARHDLHGYYYEAKVVKQDDSRHVSVVFENGVEQDNMPTLFILRLDGPGSRSHLDLGDYVMALVTNEFKERCYVPGIIHSIDTYSKPKLYTVMYFNGTEGVNIRNELIGITKSRYGFAANYIRNKLGLEHKLTLVRETESEARRIQNPQVAQAIGIDNFKQEVIESIHQHFDKIRLDDKYNKMYEELLKEKENQKLEKMSLKKEIKSLKRHMRDLMNEKTSKGGNTYYMKVLEPEELIAEKEEEEVKQRVVETKLVKTTKTLSIAEQFDLLRRQLPELNVGDEVLAKWPDDGWYYKSLVKQNCGNYRYKIEDVNKVSLEINREDIVSEGDADTINVLDPVVALHPSYSFSYAPGIVIKIANNLTLLVRFYDGLETIINIEEVYKIPLFKFEYDVDLIINLERQWVGKTVIARNPFSYVYELGRIKERIGNGRQYVIEWSGDRSAVQTANHIFGPYTHNPPIVVNDHVLASKDDIYLPGRVIGTKGENFRVKFVDGTINDEIRAEDCFWLSRDYYESACNFYRTRAQK